MADDAPASDATAGLAPDLVRRALDELERAGATDVSRLEPFLRELHAYLVSPIAVAVRAFDPHPQLHAALDASGLTAFERLHVAHRPADFRRRIWTTHWEQIGPLTRLDASL